MTFWKRVIAAGAVAALLAAAIYIGVQDNNGQIQDLSSKGALIVPKQTLRLWYTDDTLTEYISSAALSYYEEKDIRVIPVLTSGLEYLEQIYDASIHTKEYPDVFLVSNDSLEKAYLAGAASEILDNKENVNTEKYPESALNAVTYQNKKIGYPFYYETSVFLYNKTYMENIAREILQRETENEVTQEMQPIVEEKMQSMIPKTFDDILKIADEYDAPEGVEAVLKWDVSDIFYNYFFVGNSINVGGKHGDNPKEIDIYNEDTLASLKLYQDLNQFFSIDTKEVNYDSILQEFIDGKIVFSVVTTDAIAKLEEAQANGDFAYEYGIATIPNINENIQSRSLSVTNAVVVNGYSKQKEIANDFADYLAYDQVENLYTRADKIPAKKGVAFENTQIDQVSEEYASSIPITKMLEASNFWVQLEICFTKVWTGENVNDQLRSLSEQIMTQITGEAYTEEYIEEPETEIQEEAEYIDDESMTSTE